MRPQNKYTLIKCSWANALFQRGVDVFMSECWVIIFFMYSKCLGEEKNLMKRESLLCSDANND